MKSYKHIAIIHDVFTEDGGAERVLRAIIKMYPFADVYIPVLSSSARSMLEAHTSGTVYSAWFNSLILPNPSSVLWKLLFYWYFEQLDLSQYDLVVSSSHMFSSKSIITSPKTTHISYIHTPPRYLYAEYNEAQVLKRPILRLLLSLLLSWLRILDYIGAQRPDVIIANSNIVQSRIKKYYKRESVIIYPPIGEFKPLPKKQGRYFLCVSRLARQKGIDLAIHACNQLKMPLVIVGIGAEETYLRSIAGPTVKFMGYVADSDMSKVYQYAKALIYPAKEEDFGLVPVEAMTHSVPVLGHASGGVLETVKHGVDGILFSEWSKESIVSAIKQFDKEKKKFMFTRTQFSVFTERNFRKNFEAIIGS